jgi:thiol-disulfide isomerase/thioredoxin
MNDKHRIGYILPFFRRGNTIKLLVLLLVVVCLSKKAKAQQALQIGDSIPQALWDLKLQTVNHPEGKNSITLNEYKGKLIILDFWATWCGSCIKAMGKLDSLQQQFASQIFILPVTYQDAATATTFLQSRKLKLPSLVAETRLKTWFPHTALPHQVWIKDGKVLAIPVPEYTNALNINSTLNNNKAVMVSNQYLPLDTQQPLFIKGNGGQGESLQFYSSLSGRISVNTTMQGGAAKRPNKLFFINSTLESLFMIAFESALIPDKRRILWETTEEQKKLLTGLGIPKPIGDYQEDKAFFNWLDSNTYCYNLYSTFPISRKAALEIMQRDILRFAKYRYGITAQVEKREIPCLVLRSTGNNKQLQTNGQQQHIQLKDSLYYSATNAPASSVLISMLLKVKPEKLLIDESGIPYRIDIKLPKSIDGNLPKANQELAPYGLQLQEEIQKLDMLVIKSISN